MHRLHPAHLNSRCHIESLTTAALRARARRLGWRIRFIRSFNNIAGNEGYLIVDGDNYIRDFLKDEGDLRAFLIEVAAEHSTMSRRAPQSRS